MNSSQRRPWTAESRARVAARSKQSWADPESRARRLAAMKAQRDDPVAAAQARSKAKATTKAKNAAAVAIPAWVPKGLVDVYARLARANGEEAAASEVRNLKREAMEQSQ